MKHLLLSDLHPGRFGKGRPESEHALNNFAIRAAETGAEMWINGDMDEDFLLRKNAIDKRIYLEECRIIGLACELFCRESGKEVQVIRGNHDHPAMTDALLFDRFSPTLSAPPSFHAHEDVVIQPDEKLLFTHGHILDGMKNARSWIESTLAGTMEPAVLMALLKSARAEERYRERENRMDSMVHPVMSIARRLGLAEFLDSKFPLLKKRSKEREQQTHEKNYDNPRYLAKAARTANMTDSAGRMGAALGARVVSVGHDHVAGLSLRKIWTPEKTVNVVVANSGDFVGSGRGKTAVYIDTVKRQVSLLMAEAKRVRTVEGPVEYE